VGERPAPRAARLLAAQTERRLSVVYLTAMSTCALAGAVLLIVGHIAAGILVLVGGFVVVHVGFLTCFGVLVFRSTRRRQPPAVDPTTRS
jgi:hypothetical protein